MSKSDNLNDYLKDLYQGIVSKKPDASKNPQDFRKEIEGIETSITPNGDLEITANGTFDVTEKESVTVEVPEQICGAWIIADNPTMPEEDVIQEVNFVTRKDIFDPDYVNGKQFNKIELSATVYYINTTTGEEVEPILPDGTFNIDEYRRVDFGTTPQAVSKAFYDAFTSIATIEIVEDWDGTLTIQDTTILISFTISGTAYQAEEGMTWEQWVASDYSGESSYVTSEGYVVAYSLDNIFLGAVYDETANNTLLADVEIENGRAYITTILPS